MAGDSTIFTDGEREALCVSDDCAEHAGGDAECNVPKTKDEAEGAFAGGNTGALVGDAEPKTATGLVVRSEEGE